MEPASRSTRARTDGAQITPRSEPLTYRQNSEDDTVDDNLLPSTTTTINQTTGLFGQSLCNIHTPSLDTQTLMSLVAGPGVGGNKATTNDLPPELGLVIENHVKYIQSLDTVRSCGFHAPCRI